MDLTTRYVSPVDRVCGHTPEQYARAQLDLQPLGDFWSRDNDTKKAALFRAAGGVFSELETLICDWLVQQRGCNADYITLELFEQEYGTLQDCTTPVTLAERKARVCAAVRGSNALTPDELQELLRQLLGCDSLTLRLARLDDAPANPMVMYIGGITSATIPSLDNWYGDDGLYYADLQSYTIDDPDFTQNECAVFGDNWYSDEDGMYYADQQAYIVADDASSILLDCILKKYVPAHIKIIYD